jgi:hypothetical protein
MGLHKGSGGEAGEALQRSQQIGGDGCLVVQCPIVQK